MDMVVIAIHCFEYFSGHTDFRACHAFLSVHCSLVVICWERANLLALLYVMFYCVLSLSHVVSLWYLIVSYLLLWD